MYGGEGGDTLSGDGGRDRLISGAGEDTIFADDNQRDIINCGDGGADAVDFDADLDRVRNCEIFI